MNNSNPPRPDWNYVSCPCLLLNKWWFCSSQGSSPKPRRHLHFLPFPHSSHLTRTVGATKIYLQSDHFKPLHWGHPTPATLFLLGLRLQTLNNAPAFMLSFYYCPPSTQPVQVIFTKGKSDHFPPSHSFPSRLACGWSKVSSVAWWAWHPLVPAGFTRGISHHSLFYSLLLMLAFSPFSEHIQLAPA